MPTILYIESNFDNMLVVKRALEARGHQLIWAAEGQQGLELARTCQPDLILLDTRLPDMEGEAVIRCLRADARHPARNVPVIALTANLLSEAEETALAAGCDVYMTKPFRLRDLWAQVAAARHEAG